MAPQPKKKTKTKAPAKSKTKTKKPALKKAAKPKLGKKAAGGVPEALKNAALAVLDDRQAEDILAFDVRGRSAMADYVIVASGRSNRQVAAMADYLRAAFEKAGVRRVRVEGLPQGDWVLVDAGDILIHLFRPEVRKYYDIEKIWNKSPRGG